MSILVTGGAGYIGSHMVHELADAGEGIVVVDNLSTGFEWAIAAGVPFILGDIGDQNLVGQIIREHKIEAIIHFAASAIVPDSVKRSTWLLQQQYCELTGINRNCNQKRCAPFHLFIDLRCLWQSGASAGVRGHAGCTDVALWQL